VKEQASRGSARPKSLHPLTQKHQIVRKDGDRLLCRPASTERLIEANPRLASR
jgi:hypothetical protein